MAASKKLGEILVDANILTQEQLEQALRIQNEKGGKLGNILIDLGLIDERTVADIISKQRNFLRITLDLSEIDHSVLNLIPKDICQKFRIIPYKIEDNQLIVAMDDPLNYYAIDMAEFVSAYRVLPAIVEPSKIDEALAFVSEEIDQEQVKEQYQTALDEVSEKPSLPEDTKGDIIKFVNMALLEGLKLGASDIHFEADPKNTRVRYRVNGVLQERFRVPAEYHDKIISRLKVMAKLDISERDMPQTGGFRLEHGDDHVTMRMEIMPTVRGENIAIRFAAKGTKVEIIEELGFSPREMSVLTENIFKPGGLIIVCGPTGSGKTSTLYAILRKLNTPEKKIITLENPVEEFLPLVNQIQIAPEKGLTFAAALRSVLRMDPDIILVGEVNDPDTARIAMRAAYTGHLVLTTLHTRNTFESVFRLIDLGIEPFLLVDTINLIIGQRLIRTLCKECKASSKLADGRIVYNPHGCQACKNTGYSGRTGVFELLPGHFINRDILKPETASIENMVKHAKKEGIETLWQKGLKKVLDGETSMTEIVRTIPKLTWE